MPTTKYLGPCPGCCDVSCIISTCGPHFVKPMAARLSFSITGEAIPYPCGISPAGPTVHFEVDLVRDEDTCFALYNARQYLLEPVSLDGYCYLYHVELDGTVVCDGNEFVPSIISGSVAAGDFVYGASTHSVYPPYIGSPVLGPAPFLAFGTGFTTPNIGAGDPLCRDKPNVGMIGEAVFPLYGSKPVITGHVCDGESFVTTFNLVSSVSGNVIGSGTVISL